MSQSPNIEQNSDSDISNFWISRQSPKPDKKNKTTSKKIDDDAMLENCNVIAIFPIYGKFEEIRKPGSGRIVSKTYIIINSNLLSYKNWKQN